jgi:ubiquinone/menaquinone biosynthesis C-methylase UbiE
MAAATKGTPQSPPSPAPIFELATAFMRSKHLFAASELGIFAALAAGPRTLAQLAVELRLPARTLRIAVDAVTALGLLEREGDTYRNGALAQAYLSGRGPGDMRAFMRFYDRLSYVRWMTLEDSIRLGRGVAGAFNFNAQEQEIFSRGVEDITDSHALALAADYDFSRQRRLLDLGGGTGNFLTAILERFPQMQGTLFELPGAAELARARLAQHALSRQVRVIGGDFFKDPIPAGHDTLLLAHVVHVLNAERNFELLRLARRACEAGARLLMVDFWTDPTHTEPLEAALLAGEFLVMAADGDVYSVEEMREWLGGSGWRFLEHRPLQGPVSLLVAEAV